MRDRENLTEIIPNTRLSREQMGVLERRARELGSSLTVALRAILTEYGRDHYNGFPVEQDPEPQEQPA